MPKIQVCTRNTFTALVLLGFCLTAQAQSNALANPGFDSDFSGWGQYFGRIGEWSSEDADGSGSSGSALLANEGTSDGIVPLVLHQCISAQAEQQYQFGGDLLVPNGQPSNTAAYIFAEPFSNSTCSGNSETFQSAGSGPAGDWASTSNSITTGPNTMSIRLALGVFKPFGETADAEAYFDNIYLLVPETMEFVVNPSISASWFNPAESGHGIMIHLLNATQAWMCWFTFDLNGNPAWICALGTIEGDTINFEEAFTVEGGAFPPNFDPQLIEEIPWGSIIVVFTGCDSGMMSWTTSAPGFQSGSMPLERLTDLWGSPCQEG